MARQNADGEAAPQGLSGAGADFVASLGKKIADARASLQAFEADPDARGAKDDLRRKLHAMGTSARMFKFARMAKELADAEAALEGSGTRKAATTVAQTLDELPALAWPAGVGASNAAAAASASAPESAPEVAPPPVEPVTSTPPITALVVGPETIAEILAEESDRAVRYIECERTDDAQQAISMARALAPDLVVLDAQVPACEELIEALSEDPLTEPVPVVIVGAMSAEKSARFVALGVARTVTAPFSSDALRSVCEEVVDQREGRTVRMSLGEPTVEQLGERLAAEVHRAIVESVEPSSRGKRVSLGEGTEVMAAVWGAIARVREVVTARTGGAVRFAGRGPEGTALLAPWLNPEVPGADRARPRGRGAASDVVLDGRRVVVADDDPGVTWFLADLLRTSGCVVHEALDGATALDLAMRIGPDLVISDILMPKMDGFALSRALKRDVVLRDTPVILLSWKEDLLQRVRELGASAAAYLRKETDARAVLARVREALWPRARIEARLKGTGEVRGRLDGLTVRTLLEFVCALRPNARVSVRDASCLYEVEVRDGAPKRVTRTSGEGGFSRGESALASLLGVGAGRFTVAPASSGALAGELSGSLAELLMVPIARARGASSLATKVVIGKRARVEIDPEAVTTYLASTPEPTKTLVQRIASGAIASDMVLSGAVSAGMVEDLLGDLATRGMITAVVDETGADLLPDAIESALAVLRGAPARKHAPLSELRSSQLPPPMLADRMRAKEESLEDLSALAVESVDSAAVLEEAEPSAPSSLADAVVRQTEERNSSPMPPPIIEPSALKPRSNPPNAQERTDVETLYEAHVATPSVPISMESTAPPKARVAGKAIDSEREPAQSERPAKTPLAGEAAKRPEPESTAWKWVIGLVAVLALGAAAVRASTPPSAPSAPVGAAPAPAPSPPPISVNYTDLPAGSTVSKGEGWLDVVAPAGAAVIVDGVPRGKGATHVSIPLGPHDVAVSGRSQNVVVREGKSAHVDFSSP